LHLTLHNIDDVWLCRVIATSYVGSTVDIVIKHMKQSISVLQVWAAMFQLHHCRRMRLTVQWKIIFSALVCSYDFSKIYTNVM